MLKYIKNFLIPYYCYYCHALLDTSDPLCLSCQDNINPVEPALLSLGLGSAMVRVIALGAYQDPLRPFIVAKHYGCVIAAEHVGLLMARLLPNCLGDALVPIPLHWRRYAYRGFNQVDSMACVISSVWHIPVVPLLKRIKDTRLQAELDPVQRQENINHAFVLDQSCGGWENKNLLLVDDLVTTGATLRAAARMLYALKPASVSALVACRVV